MPLNWSNWVVLWRLLSNPSPSLVRALRVYHRIDLSAGSRRTAPRQVPTAIRHLSPKQLEEAIAGYQSGATLRQLGNQFGVSRHAVARELRAHGIRIRSLPMMPAEIQQADRLYAQGLSLARIGDLLGYDGSTIHRALRAAGVTMRDSQGRERLPGC